VQPERPAQTTLAFHASRIVIDVGVLLAMASMSLTFVAADADSRSALESDALPAVLLLLPIFVVTLIPDHTRPLHPVAGWIALAFGLAALPYAVVKMLDAGILADTLDGSVGVGSRLMVIGSAVTLVGIAIGLYRNARGLPAGGTPGRTAAFRTGPTTTAKVDVARHLEKTLPPTSGQSADLASSPGHPDTPVPLTASGPDTAGVPHFLQPEIVFPDTGAVAREADPDPTPEGSHLDRAERADAAIDDHLPSMFESGETPETDE